MSFQIGDVVVADPAYPLVSGCGVYSHAIVIQESPLVLVSEQTDMRWEHTVRPEKLRVIGTAQPETLAACMCRLRG